MRTLINFNFVTEVLLMYFWSGEDKTRALIAPFAGYKAVLAAVRMFSVKRSTKEAFVVPWVMN